MNSFTMYFFNSLFIYFTIFNIKAISIYIMHIKANTRMDTEG